LKEDRRIAVYQLPGGALAKHYRNCWGDYFWAAPLRSLLITDDAVFSLPGALGSWDERRLIRHAAGQATVLEKGNWVSTLAPVPGGFTMQGPEHCSLQIRSAQGGLSKGRHNRRAKRLLCGRRSPFAQRTARGSRV
jgi:hypothetical protein